MHGDELRLRHGGNGSKPWSGIGNVIKIPDNFGDEVGVELESGKDGGGEPRALASGAYSVEVVWKSTSFDRMQVALR